MKLLSKMTNDELESSLEFHISNERKILSFVLDHIKEVVKRELHLEKGFPDVKRYLMKRYGYSEPAARRRVEAARTLKDVPLLAEKVKDGALCLSMIGELNRAIKEKENVSREKVSPAQKTELVAMISGKTVPETQQQLAQALDIQIRDYEHHRVQKDGSVRSELTFSKKLNEKLERCRDLASHQLQQDHKNHTLESVIEILADAFLSVNGESVDDGPEGKSHAPRSAIVSTSETDPTESRKLNKTLTPKTRREVLARDKCCQFTDPKTGQVCGSKFTLQADHKTSRWAGGNHELKNLQALCANHNRYKYRKEAQLRWI
ncbi:HNH endonuclease [compost metagenome]